MLLLIHSLNLIGRYMVDRIAIESIYSNICSASEVYYPATLYSDSEVGDGEVGDGEVGDGEVGDGEVGDGEVEVYGGEVRDSDSEDLLKRGLDIEFPLLICSRVVDSHVLPRD